MMRRWVLGWWIVVLIGGVACAPPAPPAAVPPVTPPGPPIEQLRLFWVNSSTADDLWAIRIQAGLRETLTRYGYVPGSTLIFEAYHMDVGQYDVVAAAREAVPDVIAAIQAFGPDIVVVSGDEAAQLVIPNYPDTTLPFVFCGVMGDPEGYGLVRPNVTGVLNHPRPVETVAMARAFAEPPTRYLVLGDTSVSGRLLAQYVYSALHEVDTEGLAPELRLVAHWSDWQSVVSEEASNVDFILLLNFDTMSDEAGGYIAERAMMVWMLEHSPAPVFALSTQGVLNGAVGGLVIDGEQQGTAAAQRVIQIARGASPASIAIEPSGYRLLMNMAAARHWDLRIPVMLPLAAEIYRTLPGGIAPATAPGGSQ